MKLSVMYRGPLTSCNYQCDYCPFSKRQESEAQLQRDQVSLARFTDWIQTQSNHQWKILFTPWGEALVRAWYREAIIQLGACPHVESVSIQTNLSCGLDWVERCDTRRVSFWATFHPTETTRDAFVSRVLRLSDRGFAISVGVVGIADHLSEIQQLRQSLPSEIYLWINAQQPRPRPYTQQELDEFTSIDPQFPLTVRRIRSRDRYCPAGETSLTIDGEGAIRRCHFVDDNIGNIYAPDWEMALRSRPCPNLFCDCFLGKAQLESTALLPFFGDGLFTRQSGKVAGI